MYVSSGNLATWDLFLLESLKFEDTFWTSRSNRKETKLALTSTAA